MLSGTGGFDLTPKPRLDVEKVFFLSCFFYIFLIIYICFLDQKISKGITKAL